MITDFNQLDLNKTYSYADYLTWQFKERLELIKGKIFKMSPAPSSYHQSIVSELISTFNQGLKGKPCKVYPAPFDVRLANINQPDEKVYSVVQPDISVVCNPQKIDAKGCKGAPDLVIEIISKSTVQKDLHEKYELYESAGVMEYWVIHPHEQTLIKYTLDQDGKYQPSRLMTRGDIVKSNVLTGIAIDLNEIFEHTLQEPEEEYGNNVIRID